MVLDLVTFTSALLTKRSEILLISWAWLGINFLATAALLLLPGTGYLLAMVCSASLFLLAFDLTNFLESTYPLRARARDMDHREYEMTWRVVKRHVKSAVLVVAFSTAFTVAGVTAYVPIVFPNNPVLLVVVAFSVILVLTAGLSFSLGTRQNIVEAV